jgi:murein DD-endopeptidase MepM/ murein hydrolase activator NlpD
MGASAVGLADDAAVAAEPVVKSAPTLMPPTLDKTAVIPENQLEKVDLTAAETPVSYTNSDTTSHNTSQAPVAQEPVQEHVTHVVQSGHTLWRIANAYEVTAGAIATANGLPSIETPLEIGEVLRIPVTDTMVYPPREIIAPEPSPAVAEVDDRDRQPTQITSTTPADSSSNLSDETLGNETLGNETLGNETLGNETRNNNIAARSRSTAPSSVVNTHDKLSRLTARETASEGQPESLSSYTGVGGLNPDKQPSATSTVEAPILGSPDRVTQSATDSAIDSATDSETSLSRTPTLSALNSDRLNTEESGIRLNRSFLEREAETVQAVEPHEVRPGETLISLANEHDTSIDEIARANNLDNPNEITAGQRLNIPKRVARRSAPVEVFGGQTSRVAAAPPKKQRLDLAIPTARDESNDVALAPDTDLEATDTQATDTQATDANTNPETNPDTNLVAVGTESTVDGPEIAPEIATEVANENLRADISRLRNRVRRSEGNSQPAPNSGQTETADAVTYVDDSDRSLGTVREHNNPQFDREQVASVHAAERQASEARSTDTELASTSTDDEDKVAVAPMGSQNYAPIMEPRSVSPEIPSLPSSGAYLPKPQQQAAEVFDGYIWPAQGVFTSGYGWRWGRMHRGIDVAGPVGTPIVAAAPGTVTYSRWNSGGYGNLVEITHPDGSLTLYAHNNRNLVSEGENVAQGQQIAEMGSTGFSTGPHLHFEIHRPGQGATDPMAFLPR